MRRGLCVSSTASESQNSEGLELAFPEDAEVIRTWANRGLVQTSTLVSQMRLWVRYFEEQEVLRDG